MSNKKTVKRNIRFTVFAVLFAILSVFSVILSACGNSAITLSENEITMYVSDSARLEYTAADEDAEVTWTSSNEDVVTVRRGTVLAKAVGEATVTASVEGGSDTCKITVLDRTVTISQQTATIDLDSDNLSVTLTAEASDGGAITWSTSDSALATVNNGVVTATGYDIGTVTITASRGAATAECVVSIIQPSRPADFYRLTMMTNANVAANPGTWYYHADGSENSDYLFTEEPYHANNSVSVSLSHFNISASKYFYFRYQPDYAADTTFTISFKANMSNDGVILYTNGNSGKRVSLTGGETKEIYFVSTVSATTPFSIRIEQCDALENSIETTLTISDITVQEGDHAPEGTNDPHRSELADLDEYTISIASNAEIVLDRGAWYYSCDGTPGEAFAFAETPKFDHGTVTFAFTHMNGIADYPNHQLRYQPDYAVGTYYKITAQVTLSAAGSITYGTEYDGIKNYITLEFDAGETQTVEYIEMVNDEKPFNIGVNPADPAQPITCTVTNIEVEEAEKPDGYNLAMKSNAEVVATPGEWAYTASGTANLASNPVCNADGSVVMSVATLNKSTAETPVTFQLRYQPELESGTAYTATFTVKLESSDPAARETLFFMYGSNESIVTLENASEFGSATDNGDGTYTVTYNSEVGETTPFWVQIATNSETPVSGTLTVSGITFKERTETPEGPDEDSYTLEKKSNSEVVANPGTWAYTSPAEDAFVSLPSYTDGVIVMDIASMIRDPQNPYQLRYQPDFAVGTEYTVVFTFKIESDDETAYLTFSNDYKVTTDFGGVVDNGDGTYTVTYTDTVDAANPFLIQANTRSAEAPVAIKVTISDISFTENKGEEPEEPDENAYELDKKSNAEIVADPGKWAYTSPAEDALGSAPSYNNGVLTMDISSMIRDTQNVYQLRYQPELEVGTEYTVTFTYKIESDDQTAYLSFGSTFANTESWSGIKDNGDGTYTVTYTDKIFADKPFFIQINTRSETTPVAIKVTVSNVVFTAKEPAVPESGSYELELMNSGDTKANPGAWTYWIDNGATLEAVPEYNDGSITFAVTEMPAGSNCVLRYQPDLAEGTSYTFTAKIKIVSEDPTARFVYGYDYRSSVTLTPDAEGWYTVAWTGQVSAENQPFSISLNSDTRELPITIEVTNIVITANA